MNDNRPPPGSAPAAGVVPIVGVVTDDGVVRLSRPLSRPKPARALRLVQDAPPRA